MDNQQERLDVELAWLAAIIEGEGWVTLSMVKSEKANKKWLPTYVPSIGATNTDFLIMNEVERLMNKHDMKFRKQIRKAYVGTDGASRKAKIEISVATHKDVKIFANLILPYVIGEKKIRLQKLIEFVDYRATKPRSGINSRYGEYEHELYNQMFSYKGKTRSKILNDYTPGSQYLEDNAIRYSLTS